MERSLRLAAVVLAAGEGSRYSKDPGAKLLAVVDGRPLLQGVLAEVRAAAPAATVVVLGGAAPRIEQAITWADELRVRNHAPERGLASSLQVGVDSLRALPDSLDGAYLVLGDQPRLRHQTMQALARAAASSRPADRPAVVPRYADDPEVRNPVLLLRPAWTWIDELSGDRGLGRSLAQHPDQVLDVPVDGAMPDVDTRADLERIETG